MKLKVAKINNFDAKIVFFAQKLVSLHRFLKKKKEKE
jgi:hypothetical protein